MELLTTKNYDLFKKHNVNRKHNEDNVKKIMKSLSQSNKMHLKPVIVDQDMRVIDGQHRLEAARRLEMEVAYIIDEHVKDEDIVLLNANQKSWQLTDYLNYYCHKGNQEYLQLAEFIKKYDYSIMHVRALMNETDYFSDKFKKGKFQFPKKEKLEAFNTRVAQLKYVQDYIKEKLPKTKIYFQGSIFIHALLEFLNIKKVDFETFMEKLELKLEWLRPSTSRPGYNLIFKQIYNWKNTKPIA